MPARVRRTESSRISGCPEENTDPRPCTQTSAVSERRLGSFPFVVAGCVLLGLGMAGWMFPLGVIREHTESRLFAWRTGLYRVGVDAAAFLGPVVCGLIGEAHTGLFVSAVGVGAFAASIGLGRRALRAGAGKGAAGSP